MFATGYLLVWLTPVSTPPALEPQSILNGPLLCEELVAGSAAGTTVERLRQQVFQQFSKSGQDVVQLHVARYRAHEAERNRLLADGQPTDDAVPDVEPIPAADLQLLVDEINTVISAPPFFALEDLEDVNVETETRRLAGRAAELTAAERQRMNRLVLEGLHRQSIKKLYIAGWRPLMALYGALGLVVAAILWWSCHDTPASHPRCNAAEQAMIAGDSVPSSGGTGKPAAVPLECLIKSFSMWMSCVSQWFTNIGWAFLMLLAPRYFSTEHELSIETVALLSAIPPIAGGLGMFAGGAVTDGLVNRIGLRWGRALPLSLSRYVAMAAYIVCLFEPSYGVAVVMFAAVAFFTGIGTPASWAFCQDVGGKNVGSVLGWGNMWGNFGAAVTAPILLWVAGSPERWDYAFMTCAGAFALSGVASLGINATIPIGPSGDE
jgi:hypothetical protein